jgi:hypothetical protein
MRGEHRGTPDLLAAGFVRTKKLRAFPGPATAKWIDAMLSRGLSAPRS